MWGVFFWFERAVVFVCFAFFELVALLVVDVKCQMIVDKIIKSVVVSGVFKVLFVEVVKSLIFGQG